MMPIIIAVVILLVIALIYSKLAEIPFGTALGKILTGIFKAILAIFSFMLDGFATSGMNSVRDKARKAGRDDIVAGVDAKKAQAKEWKEKVDDMGKNL